MLGTDGLKFLIASQEYCSFLSADRFRHALSDFQKIRIVLLLFPIDPRNISL